MSSMQIVKPILSVDLLQGMIGYRFLLYPTLSLIITLMLAGCASAGGPNTQAGYSQGVVVGEAQAGETAPKVTEESSTSTDKCAVLGAIIGGLVGIAAVVPVCTNFGTAGLCPEAILVIGGGMAIVGGAVGTHICRNQVYAQ